MDRNSEVLDIELICMIVNVGIGTRILKSAKKYGVTGGTIAYGKGTANNRILDFMGLSEIKKEIIYMAANRKIAIHALDKLDKEYKFYKPNHGIAFTTSICSISGTKNIACDYRKDERGTNNIMYHIITIIVDKGKADDVVAAANKAGSKGGTVINARGSGIHETSKLFSMEIEPEKEIIIIISEKDKTESIVSIIKDDLKIDAAGNGIIFVQEVNRAYGLYK